MLIKQIHLQQITYTFTIIILYLYSCKYTWDIIISSVNNMVTKSSIWCKKIMFVALTLYIFTKFAIFVQGEEKRYPNERTIMDILPTDRRIFIINVLLFIAK